MRVALSCHASDEPASTLHAIAETGLVVEHVSAVRRDQDRTLWEITIESLVAVERLGFRLGYVIEELRSERPSRLH